MKDERAVSAKQFVEMQARGLVSPASLDPKPRKYHNEPTEADGITFDSGREAARYVALRRDEERGRIRNLKLQYVFPIVIDGVRICDYEADFHYEEFRNGRWHLVVEDAKGKQTDVYRIKKKLMKAVHGIDVKET